LDLYESNTSSKVRLCSPKSEVNEVLYKWYLLDCFKDIYSADPQLVSKAKEIAEHPRRDEFNGSMDGWTNIMLNY